ncbi:T9SS type B sorting domain-containing protein [Croceiramulus getboli]|nr:T9SS type B sorting domain-containing protein [Flavobacteriaceae bacterium YJPT1-3]
MGKIGLLVLGLLLNTSVWHANATVALLASAQSCTVLSNPTDGAVNVPTNVTLNWDAVPGVGGYILDIGTSPGGTDILENTNIGFNPFYTLPQGYPENTQIYVTITLFFLNGDPVRCSESSFRTAAYDAIPACTTIIFPEANATGVPINSNITWNYVAQASSYLVYLGTSPGNYDLINGLDVGNVNTYDIPFDLNEETDYYLRVVPVNRLGAASCAEITFGTRDAVVPPGCTTLIYPSDGTSDVPLTPELSWNPVDGATGYYMSIGTSPGATDILDFANLGNQTSTFVLDFESNISVFVTIFPYNEAGVAQGCIEEVFYTALGCGPFIDFESGELIDFSPVIDFPDTFLLCDQELPSILTYEEEVDQVFWYSSPEGSPEVLLSSEEDVLLSQPGRYRIEAVNFVPLSDGSSYSCSSSQFFEVSLSSIATITNVTILNQAVGSQIQIAVEGEGDYEYALAIDGPYQDSPIFNNVDINATTVFVRDRLGCGIAQRTLGQTDGFPSYFTPNGDGINDYWQLRGLASVGEEVRYIRIFDRYGKLLKQISPLSPGWDGTAGGQRMPSSTYWFQAVTISNTEITGYFALKR